jgi:hypothetical protein
MPNEENLVLEVMESDTPADPPTSPCKIKTIRHLGLFIPLGFVLLGIILSFVGLSTYPSSQSIRPEEEFGSPPGVTHILYIVFFICVGGSAFSGVAYRRDFSLYHIACHLRSVGFLAWLLVFIFTDSGWAIVFFASPALLQIELTWSLDEYEDFVWAMRGGLAQVVFEGATHDGTMNPIVIAGGSSAGSSFFPNDSDLLDLMHVMSLHSEVRVHWNTEPANFLKESKEEIKRCRWDPFKSVSATQTDTVIGWRKRALITMDGETLTGMIRGSAITAGIFGPGLCCVFSIGAVRMVGEMS